jgi:tRNA (guanine37-N1)-methyltransferase
MIVDILTLFPKMFKGPLTESIIKKAQEKKIISINIHNLRNFTTDRHKTCDDRPYGGGAGMVMKPEPIFKAVEHIQNNSKNHVKSKIILLSPQGKTFKQKTAKKLSKDKHLILVCGHYEGFDERIKKLSHTEISIGDYILTGGELAAMVILDAIARLIPGVVGNSQSVSEESFNNNLLDYPHYTRPAIYKNMSVPEILKSGNHQQIKKWREEKRLKKTLQKRPDLLK